MLLIENLSKSYRGPRGRVQALAGLSFQLASGELLAIQGPSGCGKTTLLLIVGALLRPDAGHVTFRGEEMTAFSARARSRFRSTQVGFVFQQFHLVPYLSVRENVLAAALGHSREDVFARADELLAQFGLEHRAYHRPAELSTGERQRTALARALLNKPQLLLADEPTGNLDEENGRQVLAALHVYAKEGGAVLLVTHDPNQVQEGCRVLRMNEGKLVGGCAA